MGIPVSVAVEGAVDEAILRVLSNRFKLKLGIVYGKNGKSFLRQRINDYNQAARRIPWIVLVDLNHEAQCAPALRESWLPQPTPHMIFRVAVREIESWLLGDRQRLAAFLGSPLSRVPLNPDELDDPKLKMIDLVRYSNRREIREDMLPRPGSGRVIGPAYSSRLIEFATDSKSGWRPDVAAKNSDSLARCLRRLHELSKMKYR